MLATPRWMGLFSFARTIYRSDDSRSETGVVALNFGSGVIQFPGWHFLSMCPWSSEL